MGYEVGGGEKETHGGFPSFLFSIATLSEGVPALGQRLKPNNNEVSLCIKTGRCGHDEGALSAELYRPISQQKKISMQKMPPSPKKKSNKKADLWISRKQKRYSSTECAVRTHDLL